MARLNPTIDPTTRKRSGKKSVHYLIEWAGAQWVGHDTWEPVDQLQGECVIAGRQSPKADPREIQRTLRIGVGGATGRVSRARADSSPV